MKKKIMFAGLRQDTNTSEKIYCFSEVSEADHGGEWDGNVAGYVENLDADFDCLEITSADAFTICNAPENALCLVDIATEEPLEIYWEEA